MALMKNVVVESHVVEEMVMWPHPHPELSRMVCVIDCLQPSKSEEIGLLNNI